jgi:hypothetical protein
MTNNGVLYFGAKTITGLVDKEKFFALAKLCGVDGKGNIVPLIHVQYKNSPVQLHDIGFFHRQCEDVANILGIPMKELPVLPGDSAMAREKGLDPERVTISYLDLNPSVGLWEYCMFHGQFCRIVEEDEIAGLYKLRCMGDIMRTLSKQQDPTDEQKIQAIMDRTRSAPKELRPTKKKLRDLDAVELNRVYRSYVPQTDSQSQVVAQNMVEPATWRNIIWGAFAHEHLPDEFVTLVEELEPMGLILDKYRRPTDKGYKWENVASDETASDETYALKA